MSAQPLRQESPDELTPNIQATKAGLERIYSPTGQEAIKAACRKEKGGIRLNNGIAFTLVSNKDGKAESLVMKYGNAQTGAVLDAWATDLDGLATDMDAAGVQAEQLNFWG